MFQITFVDLPQYVRHNDYPFFFRSSNFFKSGVYKNRFYFYKQGK